MDRLYLNETQTKIKRSSLKEYLMHIAV